MAESIDNAISSSTQYNLTIVSESDDVFIDSYESKQIDISDLKKIGDASSAFQAAVIGHFVNEIQYGSFEEGHRFSLNFESEVFSDFVVNPIYIHPQITNHFLSNLHKTILKFPIIINDVVTDLLLSRSNQLFFFQSF